MPDQETVATQPEAGGSEQTSGSQGSAPTSQDAGQNQNSGSQSGRTEETDASSNGDREKPSYYYENRKLNSTVRQLQTTIQQMQQQQQDFYQKFQQQPPSAPQQPGQPAWRDPNALFAKPVETLDELRQQIIRELTGQMPQTFQQLSQQQELQRNMQEAGNSLLQHESVRKNPHGREMIEDILTDPQYRLNEMSNMFPKEAANLVLAIYQSKLGSNGVRNQAAPTKGQMVSTATGIVSNGGQLNFNAEFNKLQEELMANPAKAYDQEFMTRFNKIQSAWKQQRMSGS